MKKNNILSVPIKYQNQIYQVEIFAFDTPLQIAYRFCTQQNLEFNFISPLSKQIISFVSLLLDSTSIDNTVKAQIRLHFDKFINNASIRESIKIVDTSIQIQNDCIQIAKQQESTRNKDENFNFSFDKDNNEGNTSNIQDQFQFSFKNKLQEMLNPEKYQSSSRGNSHVDHYVKNNSIHQIENLQKQEKLNQKIMNRLKNKSPSKSPNKSPNRRVGIPYQEYMKRPSVQIDNNIKDSFHSNQNYGLKNRPNQFISVQQSPIYSPEKPEQNTLQTLPKGRISIEKSKQSNSRNISPQEISFSQQQIDQSIQSSMISNGTLCNSRIEHQSKQDRIKSFKDLMNKLQCISTPQKSHRNYEICIKQQNNTYAKIEQKINEIFVMLDADKDGFIDHEVNLQQLRQQIIDMFEPVWFQILWKKIRINKRQFQELMQKRIKDLDQQDIGKFIFNGIKK
ncbi:unnamed protein product (macronuclear) [Paramecium tetraurelia]|uniref:EF-hand domain-containing protein n=1 Tax=Paramecium tetraurelia TaxID=5888 RepID=A0E075_PARTE|nr:uncharacterized protein GSPATT00021860001 [Paramecium tetraurelia]CAK88692.1 unnamed protein product [Paramecium tetraurelia]|eukprot:XP_001456089.1 hypothetical protein (macronuclear) [Paramecium tetraurelia strain d4-2]